MDSNERRILSFFNADLPQPLEHVSANECSRLGNFPDAVQSGVVGGKSTRHDVVQLNVTLSHW